MMSIHELRLHLVSVAFCPVKNGVIFPSVQLVLEWI